MKVGGLTDRFTFDPATHTYRVDGKVLPGVTTVIKPLIDYSMVSQEMLALAAERGSAAHLATELDDHGTLDEDSLDPRLVGYLTAWRQFRRDKRAIPVAIERQLAHIAMGYCCTVDRVMRLDGEAALSLVEIKTTSQLMPATGVQLAGQAMAWEANGGQKIARRAAVQLRADGTYRFKTYDEPEHTPCFVACLATRRWRMQHDPKGK